MPWVDASPPGAGRSVLTSVGALLAPRHEPAEALRGVAWTADALRPDLRPLETPRTSAAGTELAAGIAQLFGGAASGAPRDDVELCFPTDVALP